MFNKFLESIKVCLFGDIYKHGNFGGSFPNSVFSDCDECRAYWNHYYDLGEAKEQEIKRQYKIETIALGILRAEEIKRKKGI